MNKQIADDALTPGTNLNRTLEAQKKALLGDMNAAAAARATGNKAAIEAAEKGVIGKVKSLWGKTKTAGWIAVGGGGAAYLGTSYYLSEKYDIPFFKAVGMVNRWLHDEAGFEFIPEGMLGELPSDMKKKMPAIRRDMKKFGITPERAREEIRKQAEMQRKIRVDENYVVQRVMNNLLTALNQPSARISK